MKSRIFYFLFFTFTYSSVVAQVESNSYKVRYQSFVKGDMLVIGNNIVNRSKTFVSPNKPFNDLGNTAKHNDEFYMKYIDIDDNPDTFSSSSAFLNIPNTESKIVYAGLYWSAIYSYDEVVSKKRDNFEIKNKSREVINQVLLKFPGKTSYGMVEGEVIFDGKDNEKYVNYVPYVVYADISEWFKDLENPKGEYTVANIRATQGTVMGGVSGGWTLVIVYEEENSPTKKIVTYDGFKEVYKNDLEVKFNDFVTPSEGQVSIKLAGSVLEGDHSISGSSLSVSSSVDSQVYLSTANRPQRNFFNSIITDGDDFVTNRNPNSKNTLGYDIFNMEIPNQSNSIINNNTSQLVLKMSAEEDKYYSFFTALSISSDIVSQPKVENIPVEVSVKEETITSVEEIPTVVKKEEFLKETEEVASIISLDIPPGYYNIVGVFSKPSYADRYIKFLKEKGYSPKSFYNFENKLNYIYLFYTDKFESSRIRKNLLREVEMFNDSWILSVKPQE